MFISQLLVKSGKQITSKAFGCRPNCKTEKAIRREKITGKWPLFPQLWFFCAEPHQQNVRDQMRERKPTE
jgi:hypothetical protein